MFRVIQKYTDVEKWSVGGIPADIFAHFFLAAIAFYFLKKWTSFSWGLLICSVFIFLKEVIDLSMVLYYVPITWYFWRDSLIDIFVSYLGILFVYFVTKPRANAPRT